MELAERFRAETVAFDRFLESLRGTDIVVSSTGAREPIIRYQDIRSRMRERRNKPLFFIDIAVPRDIDPKVNEIDNVYLYDIDDLQGVIDLNKEERRGHAQLAEHIVDEETIKFEKWMNTLSAVPTIVALHDKAEVIRQNEMRKTLSQLPDLNDREREAIEVLTLSIIKKFLHDPIVFLKKKAQRGGQATYMDYAQQLFNLNDANGLDTAPLSETDDESNDSDFFKTAKK
jgi:glutamyl-tRNA reductase